MITPQIHQCLQPEQQGHFWLITENGQCQLVWVGSAPAASILVAPQHQTFLFPTVLTHPGVPTVLMSRAQPVQTLRLIPAGPVSVPVVIPCLATEAPATPIPQPIDSTQECRKFLASPLDLTSKTPKSLVLNVTNLNQELTGAQVELEELCCQFKSLLTISEPNLMDYLKRIELIHQSTVTKDQSRERIMSPDHQVEFSNMTPHQQIIPTTSMHMQQKPAAIPSSSVAVLQNILLHPKTNVNEGGWHKATTVNSKANYACFCMGSATLSFVLAPEIYPLNENEKMYVYYETASDVVNMAEVNLAAQMQRILSSTGLNGTERRPFESKYLIPLNKMKNRLKTAAAKFGFQEPSPAVAILFNHAIRERLKIIIEKLATIAHYRIDLKLDNDSRYEATQDVKAQLKFLEDLERLEEKRQEEYERQIWMRVAKSRSRSENPELLKLKARAKEMQRAQLVQVLQRAANATALRAIGPRKKRRLNGPDHSDEFEVPSKLALRKRLQRITHRDMVFLMEQERETAYPSMLYRSYLKSASGAMPLMVRRNFDVYGRR